MNVKAPGRICLFGEHQDYLGFPIIAAAINRYIFIEAEPISRRIFQIYMPDIGKGMEIPVVSDKPLRYSDKRDYLRACYNVIKRHGADFSSISGGFRIYLTGNIPINAGASSSSAMVIAWLTFLNIVSGANFSPDKIAEMGYEAEVKEFGEAGGMMDHFTSALGGVIYMETAPVFNPLRLNIPSKYFNGSFLLINSRYRKNTVEDLRRVKNTALKAFRHIKKLYPAFDRYRTEIGEIEKYLKEMNETEAKMLKGQLINRDLTRKALELLNERFTAEKSPGTEDMETLGNLLYRHHKVLSEMIGVSIPKIDKILEYAVQNGAYGGKINGSGFGGTFFIYCPGRASELAEKLQKFDVDIYSVSISPGAGKFGRS